MLLLRQGGKFTDHRIKRHLFSAYLYVACGVLVFIIGSFFSSLALGAIAGVLVAWRGLSSFKESVNWSAGKQGELAVTKALNDLSNEYVLLNDLMLPDGKGNVDHLVIGPNGLFVIETKNYSTFVRCYGDDWYVNKWKTHSLSKQAKRNAIAIRHSLAAVFAEQQARMPFINALLVFVNGNGRLDINSPTIPVLRSSDLANFIEKHSPGSAPSLISSELTRAIVHHLQSLQQRPDKLVTNS